MSKARLRVDALTTGRHDPSARFRVRQHIAPLLGWGIDVREHIPFIDKNAGLPSKLAPLLSPLPQATVRAAWRGLKLLCHLPGLTRSLRADVVWLNRELMTGRFSLERFLRGSVVLDIDDAVWLAKPHGAETMRRLGSEAAAVIAGNEHIAAWFSRWNPNVHIVPTAIDTDRFRPALDRDNLADRDAFVVGWTGLSWNFGYIHAIEEPLAAFLEACNAKLLIISERAPAFSHIAPHRVDFRRWTPEIEATALREMDVGIMPLPDTPWARGKCSFKMLQYMSTSIPVVASPVGMNADVFRRGSVGHPATSNEDWFKALMAIHSDRRLAREMGQNGRRVVLENYSLLRVTERLAGVFHSLC